MPIEFIDLMGKSTAPVSANDKSGLHFQSLKIALESLEVLLEHAQATWVRNHEGDRSEVEVILRQLAQVGELTPLPPGIQCTLSLPWPDHGTSAWATMLLDELFKSPLGSVLSEGVSGIEGDLRSDCVSTQVTENSKLGG